MSSKLSFLSFMGNGQGVSQEGKKVKSLELNIL